MGEEEASSTSSSPSVPTTAFRRFMSDSLLAQRSDDLQLNLEHRKPTQLCSRTQSMLFTPAPALFPGSSSARIASDSTKRSRMTSVSDDELATARNHDRALGQLQRHVPKESLLLIERLGGDSRPTRRTRKDQMHLHLSEVLISTFEQLSWKRKMNELKAELAAENGEEALLENHVSMQPSTSFSDFRNRVEDDTAVASTSAQFGHKTEGNSTFYQSAEGGEDKEEDEDELEEPLMQFEQCNLNGDTRESPPPNEDSPLLNRRNESECTSEGDPENDPSSAERIASDLLKYFASQQEVMESVNPEDVKWLVSFADAPQKLLPMPSSSDVVVSPDEIYTPDGKRILLRGTTSWAPPKKKFIFREPPYAVQRDMIETQNFRCAGCGMKLDKVYIKRTRYCNYYGKWFCQVCHQGAKHRIPAKIIKSWDFQAYPVSDIAFNFLSENVYQPVFDIGAIDGSLYVRNKQMRRLQQIRLKLAHLWSYISVCKVAQRTVTESGNLKTMFTSLPQRYLLLNQVEVYSLADLEQVYTKNLQQSLEPVVRYGELHVESCEECRHRGYFCELCQFSELLFPFHIDKVERCGDCGALVHMKCYKKMRKENPQITCTKCERRRFHDQRRQLSLTRSDVEDHE